MSQSSIAFDAGPLTLPGVNLIPAPRRTASALRRRLRRWVVFVLIYAAMMGVAHAISIVTLQSDSEDLTVVLDKAGRQVNDLTRSLTSLRPQVVEVNARLAVARTVGEQPDWSVLLALVGSTMDEEMVLTNVRVETAASDASGDASKTADASRTAIASGAATTRPSSGGGDKQGLTVTIQGFARHQPAVAQFVLRLERLGLFDRVSLLNSGRQPLGSAGEVTAFRLECLIGHGGGGGGGGGPSQPQSGGRGR